MIVRDLLKGINKENYFDVIIVGAGPAGYSAAIYAKDCMLNVMICTGEMTGGLITTTSTVDNYIGFHNISGIELANQFHNHTTLKKCLIYSETIINVEKIQLNDELFIYKLHTKSNNVFYTSSIIICSGASPNKLRVRNEITRLYYCATCDGALCYGQHVCVVGGGNAAIESVVYLSDICDHITLIYRGSELKRPHANLLEKLNRLVEQKKVTILYNTEILDMQEVDFETSRLILNNGNELNTHAVFVNIGHIPNSWFLHNINVQIQEDKSIAVNTYYETSALRVYACGDILGDIYSEYSILRHRQVITSAAEGTSAMLNLNRQYRDDINKIREYVYRHLI